MTICTCEVNAHISATRDDCAAVRDSVMRSLLAQYLVPTQEYAQLAIESSRRRPPRSTPLRQSVTANAPVLVATTAHGDNGRSCLHRTIDHHDHGVLRYCAARR